MSDPTAYDPLSFALAYLHPLWMLASLGCALFTLRFGLRLRRARRRGLRKSGDDYRRHLRLAKLTLLMVWIGFAGGLASALWLRGWGVFSTAHGIASSTALILFSATAALGHQLETGRHSAALTDLHALVSLAALLAATLALGTGIVLLP